MGHKAIYISIQNPYHMQTTTTQINIQTDVQISSQGYFTFTMTLKITISKHLQLFTSIFSLLRRSNWINIITIDNNGEVGVLKMRTRSDTRTRTPVLRRNNRNIQETSGKLTNMTIVCVMSGEFNSKIAVRFTQMDWLISKSENKSIGLFWTESVFLQCLFLCNNKLL